MNYNETNFSIDSRIIQEENEGLSSAINKDDLDILDSIDYVFSNISIDKISRKETEDSKFSSISEKELPSVDFPHRRFFKIQIINI